ncbi:MAG: hypothetical protein V3T99_07180 [Nitrososphaerales archaeon]
MGAEEEKRRQKRAKEDRRRGKRHAEARNKRIRRVAIFGVLIAVIAGGSYFAISGALSGPSIGPLNSTHDHADFILYINGESIDFSLDEFQLRSNYVHLEGGDGEVIHLHAINLNLGFFMQSLGMRLTSTSISIPGGQVYENGAGRELQIFVNGVSIDNPTNYIVQPLDKILIVYGDETEEEIAALLETVPDGAQQAQGAFLNP